MPVFNISATPLAGLQVVERLGTRDDRGFFSRFYCRDAFAELGWTGAIAQINHTLTRHIGTVRGLHYQHLPAAEDKFVSCVRGKVFDVAVDLRQGSPTFLRYYGVVLSEENRESLLIPKGFAHGFQSLAKNCELIYLHSHPYAPEAEAALNALDPALAIEWPIPVSQLSQRDAGHQMIDDRFSGIAI